MSWSATFGSSANVNRSASSRSSAKRLSASSWNTFKVGSMTRAMRRSSNTARSTSGEGVFADATIARRYPYRCGSKSRARSRQRSVTPQSTSRQNAAPSSSATAAATAAEASLSPLGDASEVVRPPLLTFPSLVLTTSLPTTPFMEEEKAFACAALAPAAPAGPAAQVSARANPARLSFPRNDASAKTSSIRHASTHRSARFSASCSSSVRGTSPPPLANPEPNRPSGPSRLSSCEKPRRSDEPPLALFLCLRAASRRDRSASANDVEVERSSIGPPSRASTSSPLRTVSEIKSRRCIRSTKSTKGHHPPRTTSPYRFATVNAVTHAVRLTSSSPKSTEGLRLALCAFCTAPFARSLFPATGEAYAHRTVIRWSITSVSPRWPATRATPRNPSSASFSALSATGCSNTRHVAATAGDHTS
mmetsp:Transcript_5084/g.20412  ORF Transcript_5084/g.20412 Transcript_5084/m.20412 type:complete len:420 (+) Transcript_5084:1291-2550(+)